LYKLQRKYFIKVGNKDTILDEKAIKALRKALKNGKDSRVTLKNCPSKKWNRIKTTI